MVARQSQAWSGAGEFVLLAQAWSGAGEFVLLRRAHGWVTESKMCSEESTIVARNANVHRKQARRAERLSNRFIAGTNSRTKTRLPIARPRETTFSLHVRAHQPSGSLERPASARFAAVQRALPMNNAFTSAGRRARAKSASGAANSP
jgi:hypothetical protein